jgi:hypothetical protein
MRCGARDNAQELRLADFGSLWTRHGRSVTFPHAKPLKYMDLRGEAWTLRATKRDLFPRGQLGNRDDSNRIRIQSVTVPLAGFNHCVA